MKIRKIWLISFSPTRTSKTAIAAIAAGIGDVPSEIIDLTYPDHVLDMQFAKNELVIIGVPVYAGRVAPLAVERLATLHGTNTPAVIVVTYGNREFEDALIELNDIVEQAAFKPVAGCAFIGEHSFSAPDTPIALGRPDTVDMAVAKEFGVKIIEKIEAIETVETACKLKVPGNTPYKEGMVSLPFTPMVIQEKCTLCAACLETCPTGAISMNSQIELDPNLCIFCCACIKNCPVDAMIINAEPILQKRQWLYENYSERREPELYL